MDVQYYIFNVKYGTALEQSVLTRTNFNFTPIHEPISPKKLTISEQNVNFNPAFELLTSEVTRAKWIWYAMVKLIRGCEQFGFECSS